MPPSSATMSTARGAGLSTTLVTGVCAPAGGLAIRSVASLPGSPSSPGSTVAALAPPGLRTNDTSRPTLPVMPGEAGAYGVSTVTRTTFGRNWIAFAPLGRSSRVLATSLAPSKSTTARSGPVSTKPLPRTESAALATTVPSLSAIDWRGAYTWSVSVRGCHSVPAPRSSAARRRARQGCPPTTRTGAETVCPSALTWAVSPLRTAFQSQYFVASSGTKHSSPTRNAWTGVAAWVG